MPLGIRPTVDFAFKLLFGSVENTDLLIHLLNAVLVPKHPIEEVELLNPYNEKDFEQDKLSIVDVKARDSAGAWYVIEVQTNSSGELRNRLVYYTSKLYAGQMREGTSYGQLRPATCICFLGGSLFPERESGHFHFQLHDRVENQTLSDQFGIHLVELSKYQLTEDDLDAASQLERWVYFLTASPRLEAEQLRHLLPLSPFQKATEILEMISHDPKLRQLYEDRAKEAKDKFSMIQDTREQALAEGEAKGRAEGEAKGRIQGRAEGEAKGRAEGEAKGRAEGELLGRVQALEEILGMALTDASALAAMSPEELRQRVADLQRQIQDRL